MYYLIQSFSNDKRRKSFEAQAQNLDLCNMLVANKDSHSIEKPLEFFTDPYAVNMDYIPISSFNGGILVSPQLLDILSHEGVYDLSYFTRIRDERTGNILSTSYRFLVLEQEKLEEAIDWERSQFWIDQRIGQRFISALVLNTQFEVNGKPLFNLKNRTNILIHERVCTKIEKARLQGIAFVSLGMFSLPLLGLRVQELQKIVQKRSSKAKDWYELGDALGRLYHHTEALHALEKALVLQPDFAQAFHRKGMLLHEMGSLQGALEAFQEEVQVSPLHMGWWDCCTLLREMGHPEKSLILAQQFLQEELWKQSRPSWYQLGASYMAVGKCEEALQAFSQALALRGSPFDHELYLTIGQALSCLGKLEEALDAYEKGLDLVPAYIPLWREKLKILQSLGHKEAAQEAQHQLSQLEFARELQMTTSVS